LAIAKNLLANVKKENQIFFDFRGNNFKSLLIYYYKSDVCSLKNKKHGKINQKNRLPIH